MTHHRARKWILTLLVVLMTVPLLSSCGKKGRVENPPGEKTDYPRKYPSY